ncbi:MAG: glycosyltransferase family 2 protein [Spirochaetaceae bacterium]|jgi:chlorobactene glucosyltransferase|nr:glycosyltransferase family 2 protein [Spirochaetaceae bacterium]
MTIEFVSEIYYIAMIAVSAYFLFMSAINILDMQCNTSSPKLKSGPLVSVLIPARNEEKHIEQCLHSLLNQDYENYEILVIDDNSTDATYEILSRFAEQHPKIRVFQGKPLPSDWFGKPFALQQLSAHAQGEIFLFTDADTIHRPTSLSWAVTNLAETNSDFISGYVRQVLKTFGERITVPIMFFLTGFIIPMFLSKFVKSGYFSAAVGQYIVIRRNVFNATKGFEPYKKITSEDIYMARYIKTQGYKTEFLDMTEQVVCRMYEGYIAAIEGIGKNVYDFLGKRPPLLLLIALLIFLFFFLPFPMLIYALIDGYSFLPQLITVNSLFTLTWLVLFLGRRISWYNAFLWPLLYCNLFYMVLWSFYRTVSGRGFLWKGRIVN